MTLAVRDATSVSEWMRLERTRRRLSFRQLGDLAGVTPTVIFGFENGRGTAYQTVEKIVRALGGELGIVYADCAEPVTEGEIAEARIAAERTIARLGWK